MTLSSGLRSPGRGAALASAMLRPAPVLLLIATIAIVGSLRGAVWAVALFWALTILVASVALVTLAGARPLPQLADQSHLLHRLAWLGRYATGAFLLCVSTFLGGLAGGALPHGSPQEVVDSLIPLVGEVGLYAVRAAVVVFLGWLTIDVHRLGAVGRADGFARAIIWAAGRWVMPVTEHPAVQGWVIALTSPVLVGTVSVIAVVSMFVSTVS